jgi:energy-coupling factor transporter ATP-binding protein EcfA2
MTTTLATAPIVKADPRMEAFLDRTGPPVFSGIVHGNQIWTPDPFDVETIHVEAREAFERLVNRAAGSPPPASGKTLLLLGEAGSGKTHLLRAFRHRVHDQGAGHCGYLQMTTHTDNYARYVLANLIDGLEHPYLPGKPSGMNRLAVGLLEALDVIPQAERDRFRYDVDLQPSDLGEMVERFTDVAVQMERFRHVDLDVIRALLWLLPSDGRVHPRALKWLRCEDMSDHDRKMLGGAVPRTQPEAALRTVAGLGRLIAAVGQGALALLVDQLEEMLVNEPKQGEERGKSFRSAINALVDLADVVPNAVVTIACLEDYFRICQELLPRPKLDRLQYDPVPLRLSSRRTFDEVRLVIARRLEFLFAAKGASADQANPVFPYSEAHVKVLSVMRPRDFLHLLQAHHEACLLRGDWFEPDFSSGSAPPPPPPESFIWEQTWNQARNSTGPLLDDEPQLADLLGWSLQTVSAEMADGCYFGTTVDDRFIETDVHSGDEAHQKLLVAVCDRSPRGGGLKAQVDEVAKRAGELPAVLVRSTDFPKGPTALVNKAITALVAPRGKGRRVVVQNSDWRAMQAFREFHRQNGQKPGFTEWQREGRPLSQLASLGAILGLEKLREKRPVAPKPAPPPVQPAVPKQPEPPAAPAHLTFTPRVTGPLLLGTTRGLASAPVTVAPTELKQHMAFLGGSGSGKTTAALNLIEQLLLSGVPAILVDRKGDLCRYADPDAWDAAAGEPRAAARAELRNKIDVAVYTPGGADGRPLALPVAPTGIAHRPCRPAGSSGCRRAS